MPLPDAVPDRRIYELLKTVDLENLTFSDFQKVAQTIYAEQGAEDELRRIVLVNLARLSVAGEWTGLTSAGGGGGLPALSFATALNTNEKMHFVTAYPPFVRDIGGSSNQNVSNQVIFVPFVLPADLTFASLTIRINTAASGDDLDFAIYNSDTSTGVPTTKVANTDLTFATGSTGAIVGNFSSNVSLSGATLYWIGMVKNAADASFNLRCHPTGSQYATAPQVSMSDYNDGLIRQITGDGTLPTSVTASEYETVYGFTPFVGLVVP
jgi:hypothetical protein